MTSRPHGNPNFCGWETTNQVYLAYMHKTCTVIVIIISSRLVVATVQHIRFDTLEFYMILYKVSAGISGHFSLKSVISSHSQRVSTNFNHC